MKQKLKNNLVGLNLIDGAGNIIDGKMMKEVGVHEGMHGLGYGENYAEAMGDYAAERNGLFTIFGAGYGSSGTSGNEWLNQGTVNYNGGILNLNSQPTFQSNAEYLAGNNAYFALHGPETTDNKSYTGSRDLKDSPIGTHDFLKISYKTKEEADKTLDSLPGAQELFGEPQDLGGGEWGITAGGGLERESGLILIHPNDPVDIEAIREVNNNTTKWYKANWSLEQTEISFNNSLSEFENDQNILKTFTNYYNNTANGNAEKYGAFPSTAQDKAIRDNIKLNLLFRTSVVMPAASVATYVDTYNCIDWAATACRIAGGSNCAPNHTGVRPGAGRGNTGLDKYFQGDK